MYEEEQGYSQPPRGYSQPQGYSQEQRDYQTAHDAPRESQVWSEMGRQESELHSLHDVLDQLNARLEPALLRKQEKEQDNNPPRPVLAPLAQRIAKHTDTITLAKLKVQELLGALEL